MRKETKENKEELKAGDYYYKRRKEKED